MQTCFDLSDIVVTGRFVQELRDTTLRWRAPQPNKFISYPSLYNKSVLQEQTEVECHILPNGEIRMVGYAEPELVLIVESKFRCLKIRLTGKNNI